MVPDIRRHNSGASLSVPSLSQSQRHSPLSASLPTGSPSLPSDRGQQLHVKGMDPRRGQALVEPGPEQMPSSLPQCPGEIPADEVVGDVLQESPSCGRTGCRQTPVCPECTRLLEHLAGTGLPKALTRFLPPGTAASPRRVHSPGGSEELCRPGSGNRTDRGRVEIVVQLSAVMGVPSFPVGLRKRYLMRRLYRIS